MTSTMRFDKWENSLGQPYGTVIQAVQFFSRGQNDASKTTLLSSSTTSFATMMTRSITTKQANSAIFILTAVTAYTPSGNQRGKIRLNRNGTQIDGDQYAFYGAAGTFQQHNFSSLDYPNVAAGTTLTYTYDVACASTGITVQFGYGDASGGPGSSFILLEIAQ
jgi:hypothetical protein